LRPSPPRERITSVKEAPARILRRVAAAALVACAALAIGTSSQAAPSKVVRTHFFVTMGSESFGPRHFVVEVLGEIHASKGKCVRKRKVNLYFEREGKLHLRDSGLSSDNGAIGLRGHAHSAPHRYILKVTRKRIDTPRRHYACSPAHGGVRPFPGFEPPPSP
jgi:hypothetical protein